jgi:hypothetical protein
MALNVDVAIRVKMTAGVLARAAQGPDYMARGFGERCDAYDEGGYCDEGGYWAGSLGPAMNTAARLSAQTKSR